MLTAVPDAAPAAGGQVRPTPRLVISTVCLSGALEDKLRAAASAGFHGVEMHEADLVMSPWSPRRVRQEAAGLGLSVDVYQPFYVEALPPDRFAASLRRAERKFDLLAELGAGVMVACAASSPEGADDDDLAAEQLHALAERAAGHGLRIAYEAAPAGRVRSVDHAWRIVQRADHRGLGLCLDSFHVLAGGGDPDRIGRIPGRKVFHVQLADAPRLSPDRHDLREWSQHHRTFPGQGVLDLAGFVGQVLAAGYAGPMALEVFNDTYQQADPRHAATDAMRSMLALTEAVGGGTAIRERLPGAGLPPVPRLSGFAFAELAVDEVSGPLVARSLAALGFTHTGQHRSKPVQLWQQGNARILLNLAPPLAVAPTTTAICALGVETSDPAGSTRRAEWLLAPKLPRVRRPDEADLSSVAAPDGTAVFFCDAGPEGSWLEDFTPTGAPSPRSALLRIDHVSLTESIDDFDQATLFYRSVLGLRPAGTTEMTAPFGLVRTWLAADPEQQVRITLNTAPLRHGDWAPAVPSPQHVAFITGDAIACAKALRECGAPVLEIPGNYYDDLDARLDLAPGLLAAMREYSVLYDRDERGEYLHFATELFGSRVFFEVVQRTGGYARYGDPGTAPLRMAAHRRQRLRTQAGPGTEPRPDRHDYSLAHLTALSLSPPELVDAAAATGYRYVGLRMTKVTPQEPHYPLASDPALMRATKTHLAATGIEVLDVELARIAPPRQSAVLPAVPGGRCRARRPACDHPAAGRGLRAQDRPVRRAVRPGPAAGPHHRPRVSLVDRDTGPRRGGPRAARG
jgi:4-hydroxyphenylpyruvate dioxygenase-like putative hemolysin/sugar phosphate isomerase/epimerase